MKEAGFSQVMLKANDLVGHPQGWQAVQAVRDSGLRGTGFQVPRDFEGLSGHLHHYKVDVAKMMLEMCAALGCKVLLACSSTSVHASPDLDRIARDLRQARHAGDPAWHQNSVRGPVLGPYGQRVHERLGRGAARRLPQPGTRH